MKRTNNLVDSIADTENLRLAFWNAKKGKTHAQQVISFQKKLETNLLCLQEQILNNQVQVGAYHYFKVYDPKERVIYASAFGEQVLHHAIMNICHKYFEKVQINDSYASRPGKGVHAAILKAKTFNRPGKWFLKLDIRKFFESIHHNVLKEQLARLFKDYRLLNIFDSIIDSYEAHTNRGLPIGNLTSQYFANHSLTGLDHFIKEQLQCKSYIRYMDDLVLWHSDKHWLIKAHKAIQEYTENRLLLTLKPEQLNLTSRGLPFCGFIIYPFYIRLSQRSKRRYIRKLEFINEQYQSDMWNELSCQRRAISLVAFTRHADSLVFRKNILAEILKNETDAY